MGVLSPTNRDYIDRLRAQASDARDLTQMPKWMIKNTKHPMDPTKAWSFHGHEYQIQILEDRAPEVSMQKCSQIGASEIWIRFTVAVMALSKRITVIYILPTDKLLRKVSRGRLTPMIQDSPALMRMLDPKNNSVELKKISNSFLYFSGSFGQGSAISVPAQMLLMDEVDFCNQRALTTYNSRLGHSNEGEDLKRKFSTPTVFDFGINKEFKIGWQAYYCVKCPTCFEWGRLDYENGVEIPGFNGGLPLLEKDDLLNSGVKWRDAFFRCEHCRAPLPVTAITNPDNRRWIAMCPDEEKHSYQVHPQDVPLINSLSRTVSQLADYDRKKDFWNFKIGLPYEDSASSFVEAELRKFSITGPGFIRPADGATEILATGCVIGLDVGKVCWLTIGRPNELGGLDLIYVERVRQERERYTFDRAVQLAAQFGCICGTVDAGPDLSLAFDLVWHSSGIWWACRYVEKIGNTVEVLKLIEDERVVQVVRTSQIDALATKFNTGKSRLSEANPDFGLQIAHFKVLKRIEQTDDEGKLREQWISTTNEDHYLHSALYCHINVQIVSADLANTAVIPFLPRVGTAQVPERPDPTTFGSLFAGHLNRIR